MAKETIKDLKGKLAAGNVVQREDYGRQVKDLIETITTLIADRNSKETLVEIGAAVHERHMAIEAAEGRDGQMKRYIIIDGNDATHETNIIADYAVLEAEFWSEEQGGKYFREPYGIDIKTLKDFESNCSRFSELENQLSNRLSGTETATHEARALRLVGELQTLLRREMYGVISIKEKGVFGRFVERLNQLVVEMNQICEHLEGGAPEPEISVHYYRDVLNETTPGFRTDFHSMSDWECEPIPEKSIYPNAVWSVIYKYNNPGEKIEFGEKYMGYL
ncbi:hypothetical protein DL95DRAFT_460066 [Leptodontidium sp. 2 PMI_412]|nr:hypothetical protein DL95DRAFT_460066 [Leptodontidium sp. 2 PMI_412]